MLSEEKSRKKGNKQNEKEYVTINESKRNDTRWKPK